MRYVEIDMLEHKEKLNLHFSTWGHYIVLWGSPVRALSENYRTGKQEDAVLAEEEQLVASSQQPGILPGRVNEVAHYCSSCS